MKMWNSTNISKTITASWSVPAGVTIIDADIVAGGGAGGSYNGGGGGGGGGVVLNRSRSVSAGQLLLIQVGKGGNRSLSVSTPGQDGENSFLGSVTAYGGGGGGATTVKDGRDGGSGGGGGGQPNTGVGGNSTVAPEGTQGYWGSGGNNGADYGGGGGGGAGGWGTKASAAGSGFGGEGIISMLTMEANPYGCGGGGGTYQQINGTGGSGCGGSGGKYTATLNAKNGSMGYGGGGGGAWYGDVGSAGYGGGGVVIVLYANATLPTVASYSTSGLLAKNYEPTSLSFTDTSTNSPTIWCWTFYQVGNSSETIFANTQNPSHSFSNGTYQVRLNVSSASGNDTITGPAFTILLADSFTDLPDPSTAEVEVAFIPNATGGNTVYNWTFGDIAIGNTSRNATAYHRYDTTGTYTAQLLAESPFGSSTISAMHTVANASGVVTQDLEQVPSFTLTLHITDSTGAPIPICTVTTSDGQTYTTTNGTAYFSEPYSVVVVYASSTGYSSKSTSYIMDENREETIQLSESSETTTTTWWTPHVVQVNIMDVSYSQPLESVYVNATFNETSMPESWITDLYGIRGTPAEDMVNSTLTMGGLTGTDGSVTFTMLGSIKYDFYLNSDEYNLDDYHVQAYPSDSVLNLYVVSSTLVLPIDRNSTYYDINSTRIYVVEPDINHVSMCIDYKDTTGRTSSVTDKWIFKNNNTVMNQTVFPPGITLNTHCYTIDNVRGTETWWGWNATRLGV